MDAPTTFVPKPDPQVPTTWQPPENMVPPPGAEPEKEKETKGKSFSKYAIGTLSMLKWEPDEKDVLKELGL